MRDQNLREDQLKYDVTLRRTVDNEYVPDYEALCRGDPAILVNMISQFCFFRSLSFFLKWN